MRSYWGIKGGESIEIFSGDDAKAGAVIYRIGVERVVGGEVKIVRAAGAPKIINNDSRSKTIDLPVTQSLFIEFVGDTGFAFGWTDCIGKA